MRLGETEATELGAAGERFQVPLLLRVAAEGENRSAHDRILHGEDGRSRAVAGGDLLERDRQRYVIEAGAAVALRNHDAIRPKMAELGERLARERVVAIPLRGKWREPLAGEAAHCVADQPLRLGE